jgi:hypothetical protein
VNLASIDEGIRVTANVGACGAASKTEAVADGNQGRQRSGKGRYDRHLWVARRLSAWQGWANEGTCPGHWPFGWWAVAH